MSFSGCMRGILSSFLRLNQPLDQVCVAVALVELGIVQLVDNSARFKMEAPGGVIEIEAELKV